jgi:hypothetical protein
MSLLEDAIREHLELKRRHGASNDELIREEADALGPARREPQPGEPLEHPEHEQGELVAERRSEEEPSAELEAMLETHDGSDRAVEQADVQEPPEAPLPPKDENAAEEPPDFLEEEPEQDRLGSEQKPPGDFDFE